MVKTASGSEGGDIVGRFLRALGLENPQVVALAGSGGKTTFMYLLARELAGEDRNVVVTTTTHISTPGPGDAASTWLVADQLLEPADLARRLTPGAPLCLAAAPAWGGKLKGLADHQVSQLARYPDLWVLVEADGSHGRPLKGWASYEPVVPASASLLIVVAGARALGRPLYPEVVHRPEFFAPAAGLEVGATVTPRALARALCHPQGPLRGLPAGARAAVFINQSDAAPADAIRALAAELSTLAAYDLVLAGSLAQGVILLREPRLHALGPNVPA